MRSTLERTGCSPWKLSGALTNPPKKREKKQVQINKSRCFQRAPIHSSPETEAKKASAIATIKQPCTTPRQRKAEIPCQHRPTHTKANAPGKSSLSGTINTGCRQTTGTRISPCQPGRCPPDHPPTPPALPPGFLPMLSGRDPPVPPVPSPATHGLSQGSTAERRSQRRVPEGRRRLLLLLPTCGAAPREPPASARGEAPGKETRSPRGCSRWRRRPAGP